MTRCDSFYVCVCKKGNFCGMSESSLNEVKKYMEFLEQHTEFSVFSENTLKPLIRMKDPEAQQKVISLVENAGKEKVMNYGTGKKMKAIVERYDIVEPIKPQYPDRKVKEYDFAKEVNNFIQWCFTQREEEIIREVIDKAIVNSR